MAMLTTKIAGPNVVHTRDFAGPVVRVANLEWAPERHEARACPGVLFELWTGVLAKAHEDEHHRGRGQSGDGDEALPVPATDFGRPLDALTSEASRLRPLPHLPSDFGTQQVALDQGAARARTCIEERRKLVLFSGRKATVFLQVEEVFQTRNPRRIQRAHDTIPPRTSSLAILFPPPRRCNGPARMGRLCLRGAGGILIAGLRSRGWLPCWETRI